MDNKQEGAQLGQKPLSDIAKSRIDIAAAICYFIALAVLTVHLFGIWTHMFDGHRLSMAYELFDTYILPYTVWLLFSVLLLDIFANGIGLQKALVVAAGVILVAASCVNGKNDELIYFFWVVAAYPQSLKLRTAASVLWILGALFTLATICFALTGHVVNSAASAGGTITYSLGFACPEKFCAITSTLVMIWVWWKSHTWRIIDVIVSIVAALAIFAVCVDAVALIACLLQISITSLLRMDMLSDNTKSIVAKATQLCAEWGFATMTVLALAFFALGSPHVNGKIVALLDSFSDGFAGELLSSSNAIGLTAFGNSFSVASLCENTFLATLLACGVVGAIGVATLFVLLARKKRDDENTGTLIYIVAFLVLGLGHSLLFWPLTNFAALAIGQAIATEKMDVKANEMQS